MPYHAFISYSHAADGRLAPALHSALHRFAKPWYRLRGLHIFRDQTTLHPTPHLWGAIQAALDESEYFILLASPDAAASVWVQREIEHRLARKTPDKMLIVLTDGELEWDDAAGAFDATRSSALPASLLRAFPEEPLYLDMRWARGPTQLSMRDPRFAEAVAQLAAPLHGRPKDEIAGEDVRQQARARTLAWSGAIALFILTVASVLAAWFAFQQKSIATEQRNVAIEQRQVALARLLATQANSVRTQFPDRLPLAALLALQSTRLRDSFEGNQALRAALTLLPRQSSSFPFDGPEGRVRGLAFTPDGAFLAAARDAGGASLFGLRENKDLGTFTPDETPLISFSVVAEGAETEALDSFETNALAFTPDGRALAIASNDGTARMWDVASARELARIEHGSRVTSIAIDPSGRFLATGSNNGKARIFALSGRGAWSGLEQAGDQAAIELVMESEHDAEVRQVRFSPDGRILAALSTDGGISLSKHETRDVYKAWYAGAAGLGLAFSADGRKLATANGNFAYVWDVSSGKQLFKAMHANSEADALGHLLWIDTAVLSPNSEYLATAGRDGTARVWNLASGQELARLTHAAPVETLAFSADGSTLSTASFDGTARLWELPSGRERLRATHPGGSEAVTFSPDGTQVASGGSDGSIHVWALDRGDQLASVNHSDEVRAVGAGPNDKLASANDRGELLVWSSAGRVELTLKEIYGPGALVFSESGRFLVGEGRNPFLYSVDLEKSRTPAVLATFRDANDPLLSPRHIVAEARNFRGVRVWETEGGRELAPIEVPDLRTLKLDSTGNFLAIQQGGERGKPIGLRVRDIAAGRDIGQITIDLSPVDEFALSRDGKFLALGARRVDQQDSRADLFLEIWEVSTARRLHRIPMEDVVAFVKFDPSGSRVLTIEGNFREAQRQIRVWDRDTGALRATLSHEETVNAVRFSSEDSILGTVSAGSVHVWNYNSGELLSQIVDPGYLFTLQFTRDGRYVLTGARDGTAALWLWKDADLRDEACRRVGRNLSSAEWRQYVGTLPYQSTCPNVPQ